MQLFLSTGFIDSFAHICFDGDDMSETIDDNEIYIVKGYRFKITDNDTMDSHPFSSFNGTELYIGTMKETYYDNPDG